MTGVTRFEIAESLSRIEQRLQVLADRIGLSDAALATHARGILDDLRRVGARLDQQEQHLAALAQRVEDLARVDRRLRA